YGVHVERNTVGPGQRTDRAHRLYGAHLAVGVHDRDTNGVGTDGPLHLVGIDPAVAVHVEVRDIEALRLQPLAGSQDGVVLDLGGDEVSAPARERQSLQTEVVGFRPARGEHDLLRRHAQEARHAIPRLIETGACFAPEAVDAGRIAEVLAEV